MSEAETANEPEAVTEVAEESPPVAIETVRMVRDATMSPSEADVHPDEVEEYRSGGWAVA